MDELPLVVDRIAQGDCADGENLEFIIDIQKGFLGSDQDVYLQRLSMAMLSSLLSG